MQAIFTAGYKAVLHIHAVVEECEIVELLQQIDPKTKKPMKKKVLFVKNGAVVVCRIQVEILLYNCLLHGSPLYSTSTKIVWVAQISAEKFNYVSLQLLRKCL